MKVELENITITDTHPDGDQLNRNYVCLEVNGEKVVANIDELCSALRLMAVRK